MKTLVKQNGSSSPANRFFMDDFFTHDFFNMPLLSGTKESQPAVNIKEKSNAYEIEVAAPGLSKDNFNIELDQNVLKISAENSTNIEETEDQGRFTKKEFNYQRFSRSFNLPENTIKEDEISAKYKDGILNITLPKVDNQVIENAKRIEIS